MTPSFYLEIVRNDDAPTVVALTGATAHEAQAIFEGLRAELEEARSVRAPLITYAVGSQNLTLDPSHIVDLLLKEQE
jgi:hypothetical protein